jgi:stage II sporulation protein D
VINRVPLETYVAGTLGSEVYSRWNADALRAQAVVTRTYALYQRARHGADGFDVEADTSSQVYGGVAAEDPAIARAVADTRSEVLTWHDEPILAAFHSASGGRTASAEEVWGEPLPYLQSTEIDDSDSPDTYWRVRYSRTQLARALTPLGLVLGSVRDVRVVQRTASGRAANVVLSGPGGSGQVTGRALRSALGDSVIRSTLFEIRELAGDIVFVGSGHGHGVGMSQWGAQAMAERGADYRAILAAFFPGTTLERRTP